MSDGFKHPVHIPKIRTRDRKTEDQPEQKEKECEVGYRDIMLEWVFAEDHRFFFVITGMGLVIAFAWNPLAGNWPLIISLFLTGGALAEVPWVSRFLPPMMAKMVKMVGRVIIYILSFMFWVVVVFMKVIFKQFVEPFIFG